MQLNYFFVYFSHLDIHWNEADTIRLCYLVQHQKNVNQRINWKEIAQKLNRLPNACKSFYQNKAKNLFNISSNDYINLIALSNFYNNDYEFIRKKYFPKYKIEELQEMGKFVRNVIKYYQEIFQKVYKGTASPEEEEILGNMITALKETFFKESSLQNQGYFSAYMTKLNIVLNPVQMKLYYDIKQTARELLEKHADIFDRVVKKNQ